MEPWPRALSWTKRGCAVSHGFGERVGSRGTPECGVPKANVSKTPKQPNIYIRRDCLIRFFILGQAGAQA
jgi:hypothetical protein